MSEVTGVVTHYQQIYHTEFTEFILTGGDLNLTPDEWQDRCPSKYSTNQWNTISPIFIYLFNSLPMNKYLQGQKSGCRSILTAPTKW